MDEMFVLLCGGIASVLEIIKPTIRQTFNVQDTNNPIYQASIRTTAAVSGVAGAFVFQINVTPVWMAVPETAGFVFTGVVASFGSDLAHRILEVAESVSIIFEGRAERAKATG